MLVCSHMVPKARLYRLLDGHQCFLSSLVVFFLDPLHALFDALMCPLFVSLVFFQDSLDELNEVLLSPIFALVLFFRILLMNSLMCLSFLCS